MTNLYALAILNYIDSEVSMDIYTIIGQAFAAVALIAAASQGGVYFTVFALWVLVIIVLIGVVK